MAWSLALNVVTAVYLARAFKRAYGMRLLRAAVTGVAGACAAYVILIAYRGFLFFATYYSM